MKQLVQYTEAELKALVATDLAKKGYTVPTPFDVEFVKTSSGMSALISGVVENVQESSTQGGGSDDVDDLGLPARVKTIAHDTVAVSLNKKGQTVNDLFEAVLDELDEESLFEEEPEGAERARIRAYTVQALEELEKKGLAEYDTDNDLWRKAKKPKTLPKVTKLSTAAEVLEGVGGVMDRGTGLGQGVSEERPRAPKKRSRRRKVGGGRGGRGGGTPFTF